MGIGFGSLSSLDRHAASSVRHITKVRLHQTARGRCPAVFPLCAKSCRTWPGSALNQHGLADWPIRPVLQCQGIRTTLSIIHVARHPYLRTGQCPGTWDRLWLEYKRVISFDPPGGFVVGNVLLGTHATPSMPCCSSLCATEAQCGDPGSCSRTRRSSKSLLG